MLPISMGNSDFKEIREEGYYYIDKSLMIRELLMDRAKVVLLPRPRRFGKTLNLKMCEAFFSDRESNAHLFDGLAIAKDDRSMKHLGAYPTLGLTFKDLHADSWESCQVKLKIAVSELFQKFEDQIKPSPVQARTISDLINSEAPIEQVEKALLLLTQLLHKQSGKKVMVLIDEYDAPIQDGYFFGYYDKIVAFMRGLLGAVLKDNVSLRKGILTGVLRIAQESLFSGLNNIQVYTVLDQSYADCFGFTEQEVHKVLEDCQLQEMETEVKDWYNGYQFGGQTLYNPWSILSVATHAKKSLRSYWVNTSQDKLIENLITREGCLSLADLSSLLMGETLVKEIRPSVALNRIDGQSIWSLLLFSGYLTYSQQISETHFGLKLPNHEVRSFFENIVRRWIQGTEPDQDPLQAILTQGDLAAFKTFVIDRVLRLVGINDTGGRSAPENFYHGLILGLVAYRLDDLYVITSNRESGLGRYDLQLCPRSPGQPGYIFEFKSMKKGEDQDLKRGAQEALAQIQARAYPVALQNQGVRPLWLVGVAFHGKRLEMLWMEDEGHHVELRKASPFQVGNALPEGSAVFVGRQQETQLILDNLHRQSFLILGSRQIGKTSFINYLKSKLRDLGYQPLFLDLQGVENQQSFVMLLKLALSQMQQAWPTEEDPLHQIELALRRIKKPVLLLNEIDGLSAHEIGLLQRLRSFSETGLCQVIMTGYQRPYEDIQNPAHPFSHWFSGANRIIILRSLSVEAGKDLIAKLKSSALALRWSDPQTEQECVEQILKSSYSIPILIQKICQSIVEKLSTEHRTVIHSEDLQLNQVNNRAWNYIGHIRFSQESHRLGRLMLSLVVFDLYRRNDHFLEQPELSTILPTDIAFDQHQAGGLLTTWMKDHPTLFPASATQPSERELHLALSNWILTVVLAAHPTKPGFFYFPDHLYPSELVAYLKRSGKTIEEYLATEAS